MTRDHDEIPAEAHDASAAPEAEAPIAPPAPSAEPPPSPIDEDESPGTDPDRNWVNQELELLISAAIVFSLFQLPGFLDTAFESVDLHLGSQLKFFAFLPYYMAKLVVYGLIATFVIHFLMRSLWVALLGLQTSYPKGIQWDRLKLGPVALELYRDLPTVESLEETVDRIASSLFAFLFVFMTMMFTTILWSALFGILAYVLALVAGADDVFSTAGRYFMVLMGFLMLVSLVTSGLDRALGGKHAHRVPDWARKAVKGVYRVLHRLGPNRFHLPIFFTLSSAKVSRRKLTLLQIGFLYTLIGVFILGLFLDRGILRLDSYAYYPDRTGAWGMSSTHYDSLRPAERPATLPALSSDIASGPFLRLFLPYDSREDNERIVALCPDVEPLHAEGLRMSGRKPPADDRIEAALACLDTVYRLTLDGEVLEDLDWVFYTHPVGDIPGWLTYLSTADLAPGKHLLVVEHVELPREDGAPETGAGEGGLEADMTADADAGDAAVDAAGDDDSDEHDASRDVHHIPFWV